MKWEILHTGTFNGTEITTRWITDMVENFKGRVPVVLGHAKAFGGFFGADDGAPADGWIDEISMGANTEGSTALFGQVDLIGSAKDGFEAGQYRNWSAGVTQNDAGEFSLHHVALLGAVAPAIKGLEFTLSENPVRMISFSSGNGVHLMDPEIKKLSEEAQATDEVKDEVEEVEETEQTETAESAISDEETNEAVEETEEDQPVQAQLSDVRPDYSRNLEDENKRLREELATIKAQLSAEAMVVFKEHALKAFPKGIVEEFSEVISTLDPTIIKKFSEFIKKARPAVQLGEVNPTNKPRKRPRIPGMEAQE